MRQTAILVPDNKSVRVQAKKGELRFPGGVNFPDGKVPEAYRSISFPKAKKETLWKSKEELLAQFLQVQKLEAIGILAGGVAHNFNNLLTVIQGYTDLCMMSVDEANPLYRDLKQIRLSASRAADLVSQLLTFSRRQSIRPVLLNLNRTVDHLKKMLPYLIGENIFVVANLEPNLWITRADETQMGQIIINLAVNARDAMPQGGRLTIKTQNVLLDEECSTTRSEAHLRRFVSLSIQDIGVGMDQETIKHIFEPFFTTKEVGKGTGLGLSVVYGIVKQHQGWINVYSKVNQGSVLEIYLPAFSGKAEDKEGLGVKT